MPSDIVIGTSFSVVMPLVAGRSYGVQPSAKAADGAISASRTAARAQRVVRMVCSPFRYTSVYGNGAGRQVLWSEPALDAREPGERMLAGLGHWRVGVGQSSKLSWRTWRLPAAAVAVALR